MMWAASASVQLSVPWHSAHVKLPPTAVVPRYSSATAAAALNVVPVEDDGSILSMMCGGNFEATVLPG
jgi:hypothetical protein